MDFFKNIEFQHPWFLLLLILIPVLIWYINKRKSIVSLPLPDINGINNSKKSLKLILSNILSYFNIVALILFIIAMAGPRLSLKEEKIEADGIDIMLALDVSTSMLAEDLKPNRLKQAKV
ncbi:MAG: BatA domain-containing protein [Saprospiraceae bacterium]